MPSFLVDLARQLYSGVGGWGPMNILLSIEGHGGN